MCIHLFLPSSLPEANIINKNRKIGVYGEKSKWAVKTKDMMLTLGKILVVDF